MDGGEGRVGGGNIGVISTVHVVEDAGRTVFVFFVATATRKTVSKLSSSFI